MAVLGSIAVGGSSTLDELQRSIVEHSSAVRVEARVGVPAKPARLALAPAGFALLRGKEVDGYRWSEVRSVGLRRGAILVKTEAPRERIVKRKDTTEVKPYTEKRSIGIRVSIDGVDEPHLVPLLARILEDMRTAKFSYKGTSWIDYQNMLDRLRSAFDDQDDAVLPMAATGLWLALGFLAMFLVPLGVNVASVRSVPPGAFAISDPLGAFDPRSVIAGFALSAMVASVVLRLALGRSATVWARGAARGWARRESNPVVRLVVRQVGRLMLASASAAVIALLALLAFWPNIAATVLVDPSGVHNEVLLPFISIDEPWRAAVDIAREPAGVTIRFADGKVATTIGHELGGGTQTQFFDLANAWWKAAR